MTGAPHTVAPDSSLADVARLLVERRIRQAPVVDDDTVLLGVVPYRRLLRSIAHAADGDADETLRAEGLMEPAPQTFSPDLPLAEAVRMMVAQRVTSVPVVRDGRLVGVVSEHDLLDVVGGLLDIDAKG